MIEKDDIEDLFRNEIKESIAEEKPRSMVWQKIEHELQPKIKEPLRLLINNVWFSVGFFALIAIPYFFFLIQNLENKEKSNNSVILDHIVNNNDSVVRIENNSEPIVFNEVKKFNHESDLHKTELGRGKQIVNSTNDTISNLLDSTNYTISDLIESDTLLISTQIDALEEGKVNLTKVDKNKEPIILYRDRIVLQEKINHVSFFFIEYVNDRMVFERNGHKIYLTRKDGAIKVSTNSDKIKTELLNLVYINRNKIFDYYSKLN